MHARLRGSKSLLESLFIFVEILEFYDLLENRTKLTLFSMLMYLILIQICYKDNFLGFKPAKMTLFHCSQTSLPMFF